MRVILAALNAKYIHTNLAVRSLRQCAKEAGFDVSIAEYTVNHSFDALLAALYREQPEIVAFSCYLWNVALVRRLCVELKKLLPAVRLWVGGPEVSFRGPSFLRENPAVELVMAGEGEVTFVRMLRQLHNGGSLSGVPGLWLRQERDTVFTGDAVLPALDALPFPYEDLDALTGRILYFETSRGCPFSCSYCLSSRGGVRLMSAEKACQSLDLFLENRVRQVKFVDRTFNCNRAHCDAILTHLLAHDNGVTNFHFEISADLLAETTLSLIRQARPGQFQFEIGVQSVNPKTIRAVRRGCDNQALFRKVERLRECGNCHLHLDLIAGLPYEDYASFGASFDRVYRAEPDMLQLGFLKVLSGSKMEEDCRTYQILFQSDPPYEVLRTPWLSYGGLLRLKGVETLVDRYYNSGRFRHTLQWVMQREDSPFGFFEAFAAWLEQAGLLEQKPGKYGDCEQLLLFCAQRYGKDVSLPWRMRHDIFLRENAKGVPEAIPRSLLGPTQMEIRRRWKEPGWRERCFPGEEDGPIPQNVRLEGYPFDVATGRAGPCAVLYDYRTRDIHGNARAVVLPLEDAP